METEEEYPILSFQINQELIHEIKSYSRISKILIALAIILIVFTNALMFLFTHFSNNKIILLNSTSRSPKSKYYVASLGKDGNIYLQNIYGNSSTPWKLFSFKQKPNFIHIDSYKSTIHILHGMFEKSFTFHVQIKNGKPIASQNYFKGEQWRPKNVNNSNFVKVIFKKLSFLNKLYP